MPASGVSGALKRRTGLELWRELAQHGLLDVGQAFATAAGQLPQRLIHVAGLHAYWRARERSVFGAVTGDIVEGLCESWPGVKTTVELVLARGGVRTSTRWVARR